MTTSSPNAERLAQDVRDLLRYVLQDFESKGGRIERPVGCKTTEDWLLDTIDVRELLKTLGSGMRHLNLVQVCSGQSLSRLGPSRPPPHSGLTTRSEHHTAASEVARSTEDADTGLCLPVTPSGLEEWQMQELAFTVFTGCGGPVSSHELLNTMRLQLEVSEARAAHIQRVAASAAASAGPGSGREWMATLQLPTRLLVSLRAVNFPTFAAFLQWQASTAKLLQQAFHLSAAETHAPGHRATANGHSHAHHDNAAAGLAPLPQMPPHVRSSLVKLGGALRRLCIRDADEYDEDEYQEAAAGVQQAAVACAQQTRLGWRMPWSVRARIAEVLLGCLFEGPEGGDKIQDADALLKVLTQQVWPVLSISPAVHSSLQAWILFKQYALCGDAALLQAAAKLLSVAREAPGKLPAPPRSLLDDDPAQDDKENGGKAFAEDIGAAVVEWVCTRLSDYSLDLEREGLQALMEVLATLQHTLGHLDAVPGILATCVQRSITADYRRRMQTVDATDIPHRASRMLLMCEECERLLQTQDELYLPILAKFLPNGSQVAAHRVYQVAGEELLPWLGTVHKLDEQTSAALQAASHLEELLSQDIPAHMMGAWSIRERIEPLLQGWVQNHLQMLRSWGGRIISDEEWKPVTAPRGCSRSCVETVKVGTETLEGLFDLNVALTEDTVRACCLGVAQTFNDYTDFVTRQTGPIEALLPPVPPLTRYKQDLVAKAQASDTQMRLAKRSGSPHAPRSADSGEQTARSMAEHDRLTALTGQMLMVMLNSLHYLHSHIPGISTLVHTRWNAGPQGDQSDAAKQRQTDIFTNVLRKLALGMQAIIDFSCTKVVFWDLREPVLESLYRHDVRSARMTPVLEALDNWLGQLCTTAVADMHPLIARALLLAAVNAVLRVLMHGGPTRWFIPEDVPMMEADMEALGQLFHADGEGLSDDVITQVLSPVEELLTVLQLETSILIANFKQARAEEARGTKALSSAPAFDATVLQQVLGHRADRAASKVLKTELQTPKRVGGTGLGGMQLQGMQWTNSLVSRLRK
ncbi:hypothetical protein WJX73_008331 [Symbiochloris irregularis]|uniref:MHD2 domain-containing protein n=1 Tax=Symbiochloris irregularis TaxID=706552 RepID=A0AAW1NKA7_9CHLO